MENSKVFVVNKQYHFHSSLSEDGLVTQESLIIFRVYTYAFVKQFICNNFYLQKSVIITSEIFL